MKDLETISVPALDAIVASEGKRKSNDLIDRIIFSYRSKLSADKLADFLNAEYDKEFTPSQIRHWWKSLKKKHERANGS